MLYKDEIAEHLTPEDHASKKGITTVSLASSVTLVGGAAFDFLEVISEEILAYAGAGLFGTVGILAMRIFISAEKDRVGLD